MAKNSGGIRIPIEADTKKLDEDLEKADKKFDKLVKGAKLLGSILLLAFAGAGLHAMNKYMDDNKQLTKDLEASWTALGTIFQGVIDGIVNGIRKLVTGILYLAQCITGTNYIAKANEAIMKKQTKEAEKLTKANKKLTTSFDELNILQDKTNKSAEDEGTYRLLDLNELGAGTINMIERIAKALKPVYDFMKDIIKWALDHPEAIIGILGGATLLKFLGNVLGKAGVGTAVGTGLAGIYGILLAMMAIGTIVICIKTIYDDGEEVKEASKENAEASKKQAKETQKLNKQLIGNVKEQKYSAKEAKGLAEQMALTTKTQYEFSTEIKETNENASVGRKILNLWTGDLDDNNKQMNSNMAQMQSNIEVLKALGDTYGWTDEITQQYREALVELIDITDDNAKITKSMGYTYDSTSNTLERFARKIDEPTTALENQLVWNSEARKELRELDKRVSETTSTFDYFKLKLAEINGTKVRVDVEMETSTSNKFSDKIISAGNILGLSTLINQGYRLKSIGLATGGIVNMPGRGVSLGNAYAGEVAQEGVIPLTDAQAMETLGEAIGRHVTINATLINEMNGRQLSREVKRITTDEDFANNR